MVEIPKSADDMEPYTPYEIEVLQRKINKRLMQINREQRSNNPAWAEAKNELGQKKKRAMLAAFEAHPNAPKWQLEVIADAECVDEAATEFAWERVVRGLNDESHSLRSIQSSLQTLYNRAADEAGLMRGRR